MIDELITYVASRKEVIEEEVQWWSWPETFGSTACPSGVGGQMASNFQVYGFMTYNGGMMYCAGKWKRWDGRNQRWQK